MRSWRVIFRYVRGIWEAMRARAWSVLMEGGVTGSHSKRVRAFSLVACR